MAALVAVLAACGGTAGTPLPVGYPLNPCPAAGAGAVTPRGSHLLVPGEVSVGWLIWHNEMPDTFACGAQSVDGAHAAIRLSEIADSRPIPWAATFRRAIPLTAPKQGAPRLQLFHVTGQDMKLVERIEIALEHQYGAIGNLSPGLGVGSYRVLIQSPEGETLAEGTFEIVE